jgi:predicted esterase
MKLKIFFCLVLMVSIIKRTESQDNIIKHSVASLDYIEALKDTLVSLSEKSDDDFFRMHCNSILAVINSKYSLNNADSTFLINTYNTFINGSDPASPIKMATYLQRKRPLIISWVSPTDGTVSFSWLTLPKDWNPENKYPLYVNLHGLWSVAGNAIEYMTYPYLQSPSNSTSFEDGYLLSPWGRGNLWYKDIAETDIWECMAALENVGLVDQSRKYLSGHSMGGYGAWSIARKSPDTWAALGIMAGAFWYYPDVLDDIAAQALKNMPTYFVCGTRDGLLEVNQSAYQLLKDAGNWHLQFITFSGGHEYLEQNVRNMYLWMRQYVKREITTDINQPNGTPPPGFLIRCNPNPVTTSSTIIYSGRDNSIVDIGIYDMNGRFIADVAKGMRISGEHRLNFDASELKSGIFLVRMKSGDRVAETKMVVIH